MGDTPKLHDLLNMFSNIDLNKVFKDLDSWKFPTVKFAPGDLVLSLESKKTGFVTQVFFDPDNTDHTVVLANGDCYSQDKLSLLCGAL